MEPFLPRRRGPKQPPEEVASTTISLKITEKLQRRSNARLLSSSEFKMGLLSETHPANTRWQRGAGRFNVSGRMPEV